MRPGGPRSGMLDAVQYGLHYGIVCQNKDPDNLDRIKVRLPWLDDGDTDQTHWAQLLTPMEGQKFGWYVLPDVDDVVVVMFIGAVLVGLGRVVGRAPHARQLARAQRGRRQQLPRLPQPGRP